MVDPHVLAAIRTVLDTYRAEITRRYGAVGAGITRPEPAGPYVITVYLRGWEQVPAHPHQVAGLPLRFVVTGPDTPLDR